MATQMATHGSIVRDHLVARLHLSPNTLRVHLTRIRAKLNVSDKRGDDVLLGALARPPNP